MKKVRIVLVALSALYVLLTIIFLLNDESLFNNFNLLKLIDYLQAWILVGLVLLTAVIIAGSLYIRGLKSRYNKLEKEHNSVKGRVFEIEEERKAEIARQKAEEEETERKLEAFNSSLKGKGRNEREQSGTTVVPGHVKPEQAEPGHEGPGRDRPGPEGSDRNRPDSQGPDSENSASDEDDDKPVQL